MKYVALIFAALLITACGKPQPDLIVTRNVVVEPDSRFYECPTIQSFPNPETLTDKQVAELLNQYDTNSRICKNNIEAIREFIRAAKEEIEEE